MSRLFILFIISILSSSLYAQTKPEDPQRDSAFYDATCKWFSAWKLVSQDVYKIDKVRPVELIFFDDKYVYSTSNTTIKKGDAVKGGNLINLQLQWKKALHNGSITLPDSAVVPVGLMSFAAEIPGGNNLPFFVMPLPDFWKQAGVKSIELGLDNLVTGVFIHEFSHSQQTQNFGKKITEYELQNQLDIEFSDDIVQNLFDKDSSYLKYYHRELDFFYTSIITQVLHKSSMHSGLSIMQERQKKYFTGKHQNITQIEKLFLTMEGLGQYSMYIWLSHPKGANINKEIAIQGVRRGGKWWSQDEGFALFLILEKLANPEKWVGVMFSDEIKTVTALIDEFKKD